MCLDSIVVSETVVKIPLLQLLKAKGEGNNHKAFRILYNPYIAFYLYESRSIYTVY